MNPDFKSAMLAAAQLTAAGDLNAATAAIQRALAGEMQGYASQAAGAGRAEAGGGAFRTGRTGGNGDNVGNVGNGGDVIDIIARWLPDEAGGSGSPAAPEHDSRSFQRPQWHLRAEGTPLPVADGKEADTAPAASPEARAGNGDVDRMLRGSFSAPAGNRDYLLYVPPRLPASGVAGLVVMLHGCTQTPADFAAGTAMNRLADQHGFIVLYPGQDKGANPSACWNWFNPKDQRANAGEPSIIAGMVREVIQRHAVEPGRVYVAGLSAGGAMAAILGNAYPELFSAVAVHSGLASGAAHDLPSALAAMKRGSTAGPSTAGPSMVAPPAVSPQAAARPPGKPVRTIVFHGRQDRTVHPANGSQVVDAALAPWGAGALVVSREGGRSPGGRSYTRTVHADAAGRPMVEHWEVQGAGHAWSGGSAAGSYTDPNGPDASASMVAFFLAR